MANNNSNKGSGNRDGGGKNFDGAAAVAEMLNFMDKESRERLLSNLAKNDPRVVQDIKQKMFVFEDLLDLDGADIQSLLKEVAPEVLRVALRTASKEITDKILSNMSTRAASFLREELLAQGPQRQSAVSSAQTEIATIASRSNSKKNKNR